MAMLASSMQLTRAADYGVRVMIHLAAQPESQRTLLPALAKATDVPSSFLSKVLQTLVRAGMVASRRGQQGGFEILPKGRKASIRDVVEAVDGPISLNVCLLHGKGCERKSWCPAHHVWGDAQAAMLKVLESAIISELADPPPGTVRRRTETRINPFPTI